MPGSYILLIFQVLQLSYLNVSSLLIGQVSIYLHSRGGEYFKMKKGKGKGWHGDPMGHARAGKKGGQATASTHDETFYSEIGRKGGRVSPGNFANNPKRAAAAGRRGGLSRAAGSK